MHSQGNLFEKAANIIKSANKLLITAGAGIGVDSGMPDYRGDKGFWNSFKPFNEKFSFVDCASPDFLAKNPEFFWGFYGCFIFIPLLNLFSFLDRINMYEKMEPHKGFQILQKIAKLPNIKDYFLVTSNVDGHFQKSGLQCFLAEKIYEVHGNINQHQCSRCGTFFKASQFKYEIDETTFKCKDLPTCPFCKEHLRPNILMFFDNTYIPSDTIISQEKAFNKFDQEVLAKDNIVVIEIGAGKTVPTIRKIGESYLRSTALYKKAAMIRINGRDFESPNIQGLKECQYVGIPAGSLDALTQLEKRIFC